MFLAQILCALFETLTWLTCQRGVVVVNSVVAGQPGQARHSELKGKAENITRSYIEVFAMLKSGNSSKGEAARILKTTTDVAPVVFLLGLLESSLADLCSRLIQCGIVGLCSSSPSPP